MIKKLAIFLSLGVLVTGTVVGATSLSKKEQIIDHGGLYGDDSNVVYPVEGQKIDNGGLYGDDSEVIYPEDVNNEEILIECR
jgi:hypothetical protein